MALFISGLFTGMAVMLGLAFWLNEREKKRKGKKAGIYINGKLVAYGNLAPFDEEKTAGIPFHCTGVLEADLPTTSLEDQLKSAIEREDFKEAARLRDLMKKQ
jgi:hypothetical protein